MINKEGEGLADLGEATDACEHAPGVLAAVDAMGVAALPAAQGIFPVHAARFEPSLRPKTGQIPQKHVLGDISGRARYPRGIVLCGGDEHTMDMRFKRSANLKTGGKLTPLQSHGLCPLR